MTHLRIVRDKEPELDPEHKHLYEQVDVEQFKRLLTKEIILNLHTLDTDNEVEKDEIYQVLGDIEEALHMLVRSYMPQDLEAATEEYHIKQVANKAKASMLGGFFKRTAKKLP